MQQRSEMWQPIVIVVGGKTFETTQSTLTKFPDSLLAALFTPPFPLVDRETNTHRIPATMCTATAWFRILEFLRIDEWLPCTEIDDFEELLKVADTFGLPRPSPTIKPRPKRFTKLYTPLAIDLHGAESGKTMSRTEEDLDDTASVVSVATTADGRPSVAVTATPIIGSQAVRSTLSVTSTIAVPHEVVMSYGKRGFKVIAQLTAHTAEIFGVENLPDFSRKHHFPQSKVLSQPTPKLLKKKEGTDSMKKNLTPCHVLMQRGHPLFETIAWTANTARQDSWLQLLVRIG